MNFIKKNKLIVILGSILIIIAIGLILVIVSFLPNTGKDKYGDRLKGIEKVEITKQTLQKFDKEIEDKDYVVSSKSSIQGRIINIIINVKENTDIKNVRQFANEKLEFFEENELEYYDIQIYLTSEDKSDKDYPIIGYKHKTNDEIVWSNN